MTPEPVFPGSHTEPGHLHHHGWMWVCGILLVLTGICALLLPVVAAFAASAVVAYMLFVAGVVAMIAAFRVRGMRMVMDVLYSILCFIVGAAMLLDPVDGAYTLVFLATAWFIVRGLVAFYFAAQPLEDGRRGYLVFGGIIDLLLAFLFIASWMAWPVEAVALLGFYVAASLIVWGIGLMVEASHLSKLHARIIP